MCIKNNLETITITNTKKKNGAKPKKKKKIMVDNIIKFDYNKVKTLVYVS